ncbi:hypothetical protein B0H12DRAFT_1071903 [Mycena haematopus]|nr:hypothetical protein B0H12DRAFT_1071903 [Mycena haematopus]
MARTRGGGSYNFHESGVRRGEGIIGEQSEKERNGNRGSTSREARDSHKVVCRLGEHRHREVNAPKHVSRFRTLRGLVQLVDNLKVDEVLRVTGYSGLLNHVTLEANIKDRNLGVLLALGAQEGRQFFREGKGWFITCLEPAYIGWFITCLEPAYIAASLAAALSSSRATPMEFDMDMLKPEETESARERILPATLVRRAGRVLCDTCDMQPNSVENRGVAKSVYSAE